MRTAIKIKQNKTNKNKNKKQTKKKKRKQKNKTKQNKNPFKKGCVWSRGMFRYQWDGLRILYSPRSDYVTKVKDHRWPSNWITLEFAWTVQGCTLIEWRVVRKYGLFTFVSLLVFNFQTNVTIFVWKIYSLNLLMWLKELLYWREVLKWMNNTACSEPCTIRMGDPVVRQEAWFITKDPTQSCITLRWRIV